MPLLDNPVRTITSGQNTVAAAGTQERLVSSPAPCAWVVITALAANTGDVYIGDADVSSTTGIVLQAGDPAIRLDVADASVVWVDAETNSEGVAFIYGA